MSWSRMTQAASKTVPAHSSRRCKLRFRRPLCLLSLSVGDTSWNHFTLPRALMSSPSGPSARVLFRGPGFCTIQEGRTDRGIVHSEPGLSGDVAVSPPGSPEGPRDGGCVGSACVCFWMLCRSIRCDSFH